MKTSLLLLGLLLASIPWASAQETYPTLTTAPAFPKPGAKITFTYDASHTDLANKEVEAIAYVYKGQDVEPLDIPLQKTKKGWKGEVPTTRESTGYFLFFKNLDNQDNNGGKGYSFFLYDQQKKPVPGAYAALATAQTDWVYVMGLERDPAAALANYEKEFARNPQLKRQFTIPYLRTQVQLKKEGQQEQLAQALDSFAKAPDLTAEEMMDIAFLYHNLKQPEQAQAWRQRAKEKSPQGLWAQQELLGPIFQETDLTKRKVLLEEMARKFPKSEYLKQGFSSLASALAKEEKLKEMEALLAEHPEAASYQLYNSISWNMGLDGKDLPTASRLAEKGYNLARQEAEKPTVPKPKLQTTKQWNLQRQHDIGMVGDTWAYILLKQGKFPQALTLMEEAAQLQQGRTVEINERHVEALIKNNRHAQAKEVLEKYIGTGHSNSTMKQYLRELYVREHGNEDGLATYVQRVEAPALEMMRTRLRKKLISDPAPDFALYNLNGKRVSLADLRGKTVIVDFWATWCGPCIQSFPSMQQAVEKYKHDDKVAFVFINSWENGDDKKQVVQDFISKRKYNFDVLLDTDNKTITDFKVEGIPTKFIIDKEGKVRYKGVGFGGNGDGAVTEISMLIDLLK